MKNHLLLLLLFSVSTIRSYATYPVDDFEDGNQYNLLNSPWTIFTDGFSNCTMRTNESPGADSSKYCMKLSFIGKAGAQYQYGGVSSLFNAQGSAVDLSAYEGIRFKARGSGNLTVQVPITATDTQYNHYQSTVTVTQEWALYEISFNLLAQTWGTPEPWDASTITGVQFLISASAGDLLTFYIDDIEFFKSSEKLNTTDPANVLIPVPKVNQIGYLSDYPKTFSITYPYGQPADSFQVIRESDSTVVFTGVLSTPMINDSLSTGEKVLTGDFSSLSAVGTYYVAVDTNFSTPFTIGETIYHSVFQEALHTFFINRCGVALNDSHTGIYHAACHTGDTLIRQSTETRDFTGAWHNAGDFGKWVPMNAINVSFMMWLFELKTNTFRNLQINIPESSNGISDLLDEAKWGLDWMLKMQNADGSVFHKVDTEPYFASGKRPDQDTLKRYASFQKASNQTPSAVDAGDFVAAMLQAYRVFLTIDSSYALICKNAALKTWQWLQTATLTGQDDPYYYDTLYWQEMLWAKMEMYRLTNDPKLLNDIRKQLNTNALERIIFSSPQSFGYLSLFSNTSTDPGLKDLIVQKVKEYCDPEIAIANQSGYHVAMRAWEYYWESNEVIINKGNMFLLAYLMTSDEKYLDYALQQLNYILGLNSLNRSFVSGFGANPVLHPFHWAYLSETIALPGWIAGGANQYTGNSYNINVDNLLLAKIKSGAPPAKCFIDATSYGCNEGETAEAAAFMFLTGFFFDPTFSVSGLTTPMETANTSNLTINSIFFSENDLNVSYTLSRESAEMGIVVYTSEGDWVFSGNSKGSQGRNYSSKKIASLNAGLYLIRIIAQSSAGTESITEKMIKVP